MMRNHVARLARPDPGCDLGRGGCHLSEGGGGKIQGAESLVHPFPLGTFKIFYGLNCLFGVFARGFRSLCKDFMGFRFQGILFVCVFSGGC